MTRLAVGCSAIAGVVALSAGLAIVSSSSTAATVPSTTTGATSSPTPATSVPTEPTVPPVRVSLRSLCAAADPTKFVLALSNFGTATVTVQLALDSVPFQTVTLAPAQLLGVRTARPGTVTAMVGGHELAQASSSSAPCETVSPVCLSPTDGHVWAVQGPLGGHLEVRVGGALVRTFDVHPGSLVQFADPRDGTAELFLDGVLVSTAAPTNAACIELTACSAKALGFLFRAHNRRDLPVDVELRSGGVVLMRATLGSLESRDVALTQPGVVQVFVDGALASEVQSSNEPCAEPAMDLASICGASSAGRVFWEIRNFLLMEVHGELRLDGRSIGHVDLGAFDNHPVTTSGGHHLELIVNGAVAAEGDNKCGLTGPTHLPPTGVGPTLLPTGVVAIAVGLLLLEAGRRPRRRTTSER